MPVSSTHDQYDLRVQSWTMVRDALEGERAVRSKSTEYLPVPPGMNNGAATEVLETGKRVRNTRYDFYLSFAEFPEIIAPVLNGFQGVIHENEPHVKLPPEMQYLLEDATPEGDSLMVMWRRITREVIAVGRIAVLCDVAEDDRIRLVGYSTENLINWRLSTLRVGGEPEFVVLREFADLPDDSDEFTSKMVERYRELRIVDGSYQTQLWQRGADSGGRRSSSRSRLRSSADSRSARSRSPSSTRPTPATTTSPSRSCRWSGVP